MDYELVKEDDPSATLQFVRIYCLDCRRTLLKLPKDCTIKLSNSALMSNAGCLMGRHNVKVEDV